ncbi:MULTISPECIES: dihydrodipicolinate synthase family protein [Bacillaceae]|uniref:Dihydrodipicolinate synthase family protein n=1 Tax=Evansella alkalicola TaxID=745819 RepID=A0ABS6JWQ0_9BACI|nr:MULTISPECIES: dihydrodipicolinate synthase family protein [Bacillaceae]MBU9723017.1 dihydrodipicolinate synthase family protein [Bacillus alkalicola]
MINKNNNPFTGVIPPVSTIVTTEGALDKEGMGRLIDHLIGKGVNGLFFLGTGGEFSQMSQGERKEVAEFAVTYVNGRVPVLIGTGATSTREVMELNEHAAMIGADGVVVINPYYAKLEADYLFHHFSTIAAATDLPVLLYNFPALTGQDLSAEFVLKLVQAHDNIVGIKETVNDIGHVREMIHQVKGYKSDFSVLCGFEDLLINTLSLGGDGIISASGNFAPEISIEACQAFVGKNFVRVLELNEKLAAIPSMYTLATPFVNVIKEAIVLSGVEVSTEVLPPVKKLEPERVEKLKEIMTKLAL